jgi:hypothetical protein
MPRPHDFPVPKESFDWIIRDAQISKCGSFRYQLTRRWGPGALLPFIMLNPSVADAHFDDPTIRRCMGFARREKKDGIVVANLFALISTSPKGLIVVSDPFGPENDGAFTMVAREAELGGSPIVCAWGAGGGPKSALALAHLRQFRVSLVCLGKTRDGSPRHPLYVRADQPLIPLP